MHSPLCASILSDETDLAIPLTENERFWILECLQHIPKLTRAQYRVATLAAQSMTNNAIAQELFLAQGTIERQMEEIYRRLGLKEMRRENTGLDQRAILLKSMLIYQLLQSRT